MGIGSAIGGGLGLLSGFMQKGAASSAGNAMAGGNILSAIMQRQMFDQVQSNLRPFMQFGQNALQELMPLIGVGGNPLTAPLTRAFAPTMAQLEQTPGYQFTLGQGLKTLQNQFAASGQGISGNALRGAMEYATGLASNTYQQQFNNDLQSRQATFNMLSGIGNTGVQAAGAGANIAPAFASGIGNALTGAGNAFGQAQLAGTNALTQGIGNAYGLGMSNARPDSWLNTPVSNLPGMLANIWNFNPFPQSYATSLANWSRA